MSVRRRLNNEIQELKGNIRVYCRVRPLAAAESSGSDQSHQIRYPNDETISITTVERSNVGGAAKKKEWQFNFNRTFTVKSTQPEIFNEISGLVQSALDGFNVCVFAYGQTGAGKTYTMEGPNVSDMDEWSKGVIPRAVEQIFQYAEAQAELSWSYEIETSFLEIYLDEVYDLLSTVSGTERSSDRNRCAVRQQRDGSVEVAGLTVETVSGPEQVYALLQRAAMHRATAATLKNDRSSRSHSVFQMKLSGTNLETGKTATGCLNLVDLAGSERVAKSGATGEQFEEAKAINKSLSTLGDVIRAVAEGSAHVPYRNSKLTRLLEPYLGGNSKTLMFVNVSPCSKDMSETISVSFFSSSFFCCNNNTRRKPIVAHRRHHTVVAFRRASQLLLTWQTDQKLRIHFIHTPSTNIELKALYPFKLATLFLFILYKFTLFMHVLNEITFVFFQHTKQVEPLDVLAPHDLLDMMLAAKVDAQPTK
jgi:kinesin family protein C1